MTQHADDIQTWLCGDSKIDSCTMNNMEYFTIVLISACASLAHFSTVVLKKVDIA